MPGIRALQLGLMNCHALLHALHFELLRFGYTPIITLRYMSKHICYMHQLPITGSALSHAASVNNKGKSFNG